MILMNISTVKTSRKKKSTHSSGEQGASELREHVPDPGSSRDVPGGPLSCKFEFAA